MARNRFVRPGTGSDSNDGSTEALAVKTITSGITAARSQADDTWRFEESGDPVSLGVNITLTAQDDDFTLSGAKTLNIDLCEAAYTASANVTCTTTSTRKQGTNAVSHAIAAGFTTGLVAYRTITSLDCSAYEQVSFWFRTSGAIAAGVFRLDLCSDTVGATPVNSFTINITTAANGWHRVTIDNGAALGSAIQSVALVALSDPGAVTVFMDNLFATNDVSLNTPIGIGSDPEDIEFFMIRSLDTTSGKLDQGSQGLDSGAARGWPNATVTSTAYIRNCFTMSASQATNEGGSSGQPVILSGGWNASDMTTQRSLTFIERPTHASTAFALNHTFMKCERIVWVGGNGGILVQANDVELGDLNGAICPTSTGISISSVSRPIVSGENWAISGQGDGVSISGAPGAYGLGTLVGVSCASRGVVVTGASHRFEGIIAKNNTSHGISPSSSNLYLNTLQSDRNAAAGINCGGTFNLRVRDSASMTGNAQSAVDASTGSIFEIRNLTTTGNAAGASAVSGALILLDNPTIAEVTKFSTSTNAFARIQVSRYGGDATDHRIYEENTLVSQRETTTVHSPATYGFKIVPAAWHTVNKPFIQELAPVAVGDEPTYGTLTYSIWVRRSSTNIVIKLVLREGHLGSAELVDTITAGADTWEELTFSFDPDDIGMIVPEIWVYQDTGAGNAFISDTSNTTQA